MEHQMNFNKAKFEGLYDRTFKKEYVQGNHPLVSINKLKYLNRRITTIQNLDEKFKSKYYNKNYNNISQNSKKVVLESVSSKQIYKRRQSNAGGSRKNEEMIINKDVCYIKGRGSVSPYKQGLRFNNKIIKVNPNSRKLETIV